MPNLSEDYDAIGFDCDHSLVKYNIQNLAQLIIHSSLEDWHKNCGYPKEIMDFDLSQENEEI